MRLSAALAPVVWRRTGCGRCGASVGHLSIAPPSNTQVEERVRFILHQKLGKPQHDSQNTTAMPASPASARVEERPDCHREARWREARPPQRGLVQRGPPSTERFGRYAKGPGRYGGQEDL